MTEPSYLYYDSNIKLLKQNQPEIWQQIMEEDHPDPEGSVFFTDDGRPTLEVIDSQGKKVLLHNKNSPETESEAFLKKIPEECNGFVAILGMGLGYGVIDILQKRPLLQYLAVFELNPGIFLQALRHFDLSPILKDSRLILCIGKDINYGQKLARAARTLRLEDVHIYHHLPSFHFNLSGYQKQKEELYAHVNTYNIAGTTTRILGKDFFKNRFIHLSSIHHHLLLEQMQSRFTDAPAILVAGGPSLDKNVHLLKQAQEKAVIFAVDTVVPTLLNHGVHPHFLSSIDPKNLTYEKFADIVPQAKNINLICSSWVNPRTPKVFPADQVFWTFTANPVESWMNSLLDGTIVTEGASTVAHLNLIAALMLGCDPIVFIGQDLAYSSDSNTHASGTAMHASVPVSGVIEDKTGQTVKGIDGRILRTDRAFLSMKEFFETAIQRYERTFINATEGGAHIKGTQVLPLQETIDKHCVSNIDTTKRINRYCLNASPITAQKTIAELQKKLLKIVKLNTLIKKSDNLARSLLNDLNSPKAKKRIKSFNDLSQQQQKQIGKIDKFHKNLDDARDVWTLLEEITMEGLKESERKRQEIASLEKQSGDYPLWLTKNLQRLTGINIIRKESLNLLQDSLNMVLLFNKKESRCLEQIKQGKNILENKLELARLYMESENYVLAKPVVEELLKTSPDSGELNFYLGCISALSSEQTKKALFFKNALKADPSLTRKIAGFEKQLGDEFLGFLQYFKSLPGRRPSEKHILFKGLAYAPGHEGLIKELNLMLEEELATIEKQLESGNPEGANPLIQQWYEKTNGQPQWMDSVPGSVIARIFLNHGKLYLKKKKYAEALTDFNTAKEYTPEDHDLQFILIDTYFVAGDYDGAIQAVTNAIKIDKKFSGYWETIGDTLQQGGQNKDAATAYERCFAHQPKNLNLLKKIGECYLAAGELESAKAAFEQLKLKLNGSI